jgi:hypothetical protein
MKSLALVWIAAGAWLLFDPTKASALYCSYKPLFAVLMLITGYVLYHKEKKRNLR